MSYSYYLDDSGSSNDKKSNGIKTPFMFTPLRSVDFLLLFELGVKSSFNSSAAEWQAMSG